MQTTEIIRVIPPWLRKSIQGLTFWVGHRCSIYSGWELSEGALVGELCNLIHAHLGDRYSLRCEQAHKKFLPNGVIYEHIGGKARVDLSVWQSVSKPDGSKTSRPTYAIEVKRATAPKGKIDEDLKRLAAIVENTKIRAFLCVIAESTLPKRFVSSKGNRKRGLVTIKDTASSYQVISVAKASAFLNLDNIGKAHYCCVIEVFSNDFLEQELQDPED